MILEIGYQKISKRFHKAENLILPLQEKGILNSSIFKASLIKESYLLWNQQGSPVWTLARYLPLTNNYNYSKIVSSLVLICCSLSWREMTHIRCPFMRKRTAISYKWKEGIKGHNPIRYLTSISVMNSYCWRMPSSSWRNKWYNLSWIYWKVERDIIQVLTMDTCKESSMNCSSKT